MKEDITIFYNLEDEKIYVRVPIAKETHYQLQNLPGKVLQEATHDKNLHDFDLSGLKDGIYFIIIEQEGLIKSKKIVKGYHP
jgi:Secretion system C-terminal sorting domain